MKAPIRVHAAYHPHRLLNERMLELAVVDGHCLRQQQVYKVEIEERFADGWSPESNNEQDDGSERVSIRREVYVRCVSSDKFEIGTTIFLLDIRFRKICVPIR